MDGKLAEVEFDSSKEVDLTEHEITASQEIAELRSQFQARLVVAELRTEAVRAGMIDLDGLKMIDLSTVQMSHDDRIVEGRKLMNDLKRNKPWLFIVPSSSSPAVAPASMAVRQKTALEMTEEEYAAAKSAVTKYHF